MFTYRQASTSDLAPICRLGQEVNRLHHQAWPQIFPQFLDQEKYESEWRNILAAEDTAVFVAEEEGAVIGLLTVKVVSETYHRPQPVCFAWAGIVSVDETKRGQGVGRALTSLAESWAAERGAVDMRLHVWSFNGPAIHHCEEMGYQIRALEMGKTLVPKCAT
jgi:GNAT superfamily N-acetyltransferase